MTEGMFDRALPLFGEEGMERLARSRVALFGVGGVGGACAEALVRGGVGHLTIVDGDVFTPSNLNRQRFAFRDGLGEPKAEYAARELERISPSADIVAVNKYYSESSALDFGVRLYRRRRRRSARKDNARRAGARGRRAHSIVVRSG